MLPLLLAIALAAPVDRVLAGDVDAAVERVRTVGFDAVDAELRALPVAPFAPTGTYTVVQPPSEDGLESADVHLVALPDGRQLLVFDRGWLGPGPDHLGNARRWYYELAWSERRGEAWSEPRAFGTSHMAVEPFVDEAGRLHVFANGYNQAPEPDAFGVAPGRYQVLHARLEGEAFTTWRPVLPDSPDLLHGWDVADAGDGSLLFAWAPWFRGSHDRGTNEQIRVRVLRDEGLGEPWSLPALDGRNLTTPQFVGDALYASAQTHDYGKLGYARLDVQGGPPKLLLAEGAADFLRLAPEAGGPEVFVWREADEGGPIVHIGERELPMPPWGDSLGGLRLGVYGEEHAALAYDGAVYLLRADKRGWEAQLLAPAVAETGDSPFPRRFAGEPSLHVDGDQATVAWWDAARGLVVWRGEVAPTGHWPEITWAQSAGLGLGSGAKAWLGAELMRRAEGADPEEAACLADIVGVGLRELGGPGYRAGGAPAAVPEACFTAAASPASAIPTPPPKPPR